jgi:hypothetical protein
MVGVAGFEPTTSRTPSVRATKLRYTPTISEVLWINWIKGKRVSVVITIPGVGQLTLTICFFTAEFPPLTVG